jgi:DNA-binding CsgD family transcriptional regulator
MNDKRILDKLNPMEKRILALAVDGLRNADIADQVGISVQMVKNYMRNIYDVTGMSHGRELLAFVYNKPELLEALRAVDVAA